MTTAHSNRPKSVRSATSAPLPAKTAASCAATEAISTRKSSGRRLLRPAAIALRPRAARFGPNLPEAARAGRDFLGTTRCAEVPLPEDRAVRCCCAWFRPISVPSLEPAACGVQGESGEHQHVEEAPLSPYYQSATNRVGAPMRISTLVSCVVLLRAPSTGYAGTSSTWLEADFRKPLCRTVWRRRDELGF